MTSLIEGLSVELATALVVAVMFTYTYIGCLGATFYVSYFNTSIIFIIMLVFLVKVYHDDSDRNPLGEKTISQLNRRYFNKYIIDKSHPEVDLNEKWVPMSLVYLSTYLMKRINHCVSWSVWIPVHSMKLVLNDFHNYQVHLRWCMDTLPVVRQKITQMIVIWRCYPTQDLCLVLSTS